MECQGCGAVETRPFYEARDIPVHSCLLMRTRDAALRYPRGDLRLAFCTRCGFVQNDRFDPRLHEYSPDYEETQSFSPRFNAFAETLARDLVERHGLRDREILEIGCGKGEFLVLLCELGGNRGVGIDPGVRPERTGSEAASRIDFRRDFYSEQNAGELSGDLVCCRHTLEHIQPVRTFLELVRRSAERRPGCVVFFEVPDVRRVLEQGAFWDVYYEHCSYFGAGSLARLFRCAGFAPEKLWTGFDDQYLMLEARLGSGPPACLGAEDDLDALAAAVEGFRTGAARRVDHWRAELERFRREGRRVVLWGSGSKGVAFLTTLGAGDEVSAVVDVNPHKVGRFMPGTGQEIVGPDALGSDPPQLVIAMNPIYREEIARDLSARGIAAELRCLGRESLDSAR